MFNRDIVYWCIKQSIESEGYNELKPKYPWKGKITRINGDIAWLSRIGELYPNGDTDSNATALVKEKDLFKTKELAMIEHKKEIQQYIKHLMVEIELCIAQLSEI